MYVVPVQYMKCHVYHLTVQSSLIDETMVSVAKVRLPLVSGERAGTDLRDKSVSYRTR
jgi:hypothetical protein